MCVPCRGGKKEIRGADFPNPVLLRHDLLEYCQCPITSIHMLVEYFMYVLVKLI